MVTSKGLMKSPSVARVSAFSCLNVRSDYWIIWSRSSLHRTLMLLCCDCAPSCAIISCCIELGESSGYFFRACFLLVALLRLLVMITLAVFLP